MNYTSIMVSKRVKYTLLLFLFLSMFIPSDNTFAQIVKKENRFSYYPSDNYADEVIDQLSSYYLNGENSLGAPDGLFTTIFHDYSNGLLTLDLGRYEVVSDSAGDDITVYAENGTYIIKIGNDLSTPFTTLGSGNTTKSFDIDTIGFSQVRFVQIHYSEGVSVKLDAIEVINLYTPVTDINDPIISGPEDFQIYDNETEISFVWSVSDATKWNYSILVNGVNHDSGEWDDVSITFEWTSITVQNLTISLVLFDFFGNSAQDTVNVEIRPLPTKTTFNLVFLLPIALYLYFKRRSM